MLVQFPVDVFPGTFICMDFIHLVSQIKESSFVHDLTINSNSIQYVLVSEKQLADMRLFCTHPILFSIFSIESTYDVGNYYVTNTFFKNLKVVHADESAGEDIHWKLNQHLFIRAKI
jgi:hypothetical protein